LDAYWAVNGQAGARAAVREAAATVAEGVTGVDQHPPVEALGDAPDSVLDGPIPAPERLWTDLARHELKADGQQIGERRGWRLCS
jgi:hypothetical protein